MAVRLNVGTCAVGETDGTPTGEESAIHSLRVYAFVKGQLAGHEFRSGDMETPATFWMDLTMTSLTTETVDFYRLGVSSSWVAELPRQAKLYRLTNSS